MARINIEECWWSDPRRTKLLLKIGFAADSAAVNMWRVAQEFWAKGKHLIPKNIFDSLEFSQDLVGCSLADVRDEFVYVRGSSAYLTWLQEKREQARAAGKKSAKRARNAKGQLTKSPNETPTNFQREPNEVQPSGSGSLSGSDSGTGSSIFPPGGAAAPAKGNSVVAEYYRCWQAQYPGERPVVLPQHHKFLKDLGDQEGSERAAKYVQAYLSMPDPWFVKKRHDVETFRQNLNSVSHFIATGKVVTSEVIKQVEKQVDKQQGTKRRRSLEEIEAERDAQRAEAEGARQLTGGL